MYYLDPHIHMVSRTTDDYETLAKMGCVAMSEPAFWAGFDRGSAESFRDYFRQLTQFERARAGQYCVQHYTWLCINAKEAEDVELSRQVIAMIPEFLDQPGVLGIGEIGLNKNTRNEAIVFLAHGAPSHELLCDRVMRRITAYCCGKTGIQYADWAYVGVGQQYRHKGLPAIRQAAETRDRVLVVGLYLSSHAQRIHERGMGSGSHSGDHGAPALPGKTVLYSSEGIVASPFVADWVLETATEAVEALER